MAKSLGTGAARHDVAEMFESCVGCKWTLHILGQIRKGRTRPGQLERSAPGLTTKVLNERLRKLVRFGVLDRTVFAEVPPRTEYGLTPFGRRFVSILDDIDRLRDELGGGTFTPPPKRPAGRPARTVAGSGR